jgi:hypothetical protein
LLLVSQTAKQKRLLRLYGRNVIGLDATYKTNKWGLPMFLLNVVTNHGKGFPVGLFFVEEETGENGSQAGSNTPFVLVPSRRHSYWSHLLLSLICKA